MMDAQTKIVVPGRTRPSAGCLATVKSKPTNLFVPGLGLFAILIALPLVVTFDARFRWQLVGSLILLLLPMLAGLHWLSTMPQVRWDVSPDGISCSENGADSAKAPWCEISRIEIRAGLRMRCRVQVLGHDGQVLLDAPLEKAKIGRFAWIVGPLLPDSAEVIRTGPPLKLKRWQAGALGLCCLCIGFGGQEILEWAGSFSNREFALFVLDNIFWIVPLLSLFIFGGEALVLAALAWRMVTRFRGETKLWPVERPTLNTALAQLHMGFLVGEHRFAAPNSVTKPNRLPMLVLLVTAALAALFLVGTIEDRQSLGLLPALVVGVVAATAIMSFGIAVIVSERKTRVEMNRNMSDSIILAPDGVWIESNDTRAHAAAVHCSPQPNAGLPSAVSGQRIRVIVDGRIRYYDSAAFVESPA